MTIVAVGGTLVAVAVPDDVVPLTLIAVGTAAFPTSIRIHCVLHVAPAVTLPTGLVSVQTDCHS
jgi:hypothetical protein